MPHIHLDFPESGIIRRPIFSLIGWYALDVPPTTLRMELDGEPIAFQRVDRPDVRAAFPESVIDGFSTVVDLVSLQPESTSSTCHLALLVDGQEIATQALTIDADVRRRVRTSAAAKQAKRRWLGQHLRCPVCRTDQRLLHQGALFRCPACLTSYPIGKGALDFLPPGLRESFRIFATTDVSAHGYDPTAQAIIEDVRARGGKVLDCGSGLHPEVDETVVTSEVADYGVDILAVNQSLPFRDDTFDAVLSLNVLEHVTDPFQSAAELARVLKPGGTMYCVVPFLQPEHGYPDHYFNMTRSGIRQLFPAPMVVKRHEVPSSGQPIWALHWFLSWYVEHLPEEVRRRFAGLTVADLLSKGITEWLDDEIVTSLSQDGQWKLASTTALVMEKATRSP